MDCGKLHDVDQGRLAEALPFAADQADLLLQLGEHLDRFLIAAVHIRHNIFDGVNDVYAALLVQPLVLIDSCSRSSIRPYRSFASFDKPLKCSSVKSSLGIL